MCQELSCSLHSCSVIPSPQETCMGAVTIIPSSRLRKRGQGGSALCQRQQEVAELGQELGADRGFVPSLMLADRVRGLGAGQSPVRRGLQLAMRLPQVKPMFTERNRGFNHTLMVPDGARQLSNRGPAAKRPSFQKDAIVFSNGLLTVFLSFKNVK